MTVNTSTSPKSFQFEEVITYSPARVNNYRSLKNLATTYNIWSYLSFFGGLVLGAVFAIIGGLITAQVIDTYEPTYGYADEYTVTAILALVAGMPLYILSGASIVGGILSSFLFVFRAQSIHVMLDIEANSRQTAKTLERILRIQGGE